MLRSASTRVIGCAALLCLFCCLPGCTSENPDFLPEGPDALALTPTISADLGDLAAEVGGDSTPGDGDHANRVDAGTAPPPPPPPPPPDAGGSGLARLCQGDDCNPGEICLFMERGARTGVCLRTCDNPNEFCSAPDPLVSGCTEYYNSDVGRVNVCMVFCRLGQQEYPCPDETSYRCKDYGGWAACIAE
jgi:hypothetical protein